MVALAALFLGLSIGAYPAAAQSTESTGLAATPNVTVRGGVGNIRTKTFPFNPAGAQSARDEVHDRSKCGDAFCTIQIVAGNYKVFKLSGCDTFDLHAFGGLFDSHNHGSLTAQFLDQWNTPIGWYRGGMKDPVQWDPVYAVRLCQP
ncbi:hypothetical protein ACQP2T_10675 [Nonomuraea sp. CA-143628]|uniref:hypothetical protein n=1 Tax=Nonomuraea sp. CA-143628 TaxID=3239997 RepID=UPI003D8EEF14